MAGILAVAAPWPVLAAFGILWSGTAAAATVLVRTRMWKVDDIKVIKVLEWGVLVFVAAVVLLTSEPWLPQERLHLTAAPIVVGYVIGADEGRYAVMWAADRTVVWIPTADVTGREVCVRDSRLLRRSLLAVVVRWRTPHYPECP